MANEVNDGSDKVERINQGDRTSDNTSKDSVIGGDRKDHQQIHQEASKAGQKFVTFSDNDDDQSFQALKPGETLEQYQARLTQRPEQATDKPKIDSFGIDFGDGTVETSIGLVSKPHTQEFFEAKAQGAMTAMQNLDQEPQYQADQLVAANVTPNNPIRSDATLPDPDEVKESDLPDDSVAWGEDKLIPRVTIPSGDRVVFPYRGMEDFKLAECTEANPNAWNNALEAYPKLQKYLGNADGIKLMKSLVRNELHWFDIKDRQGDNQAKAGNPDYDETLGYAQITPRGVSEFETGIIRGQQVRPPDSKLAEFIKSKGYTGSGHEAKALEDPSCAPMIVAAKLNTLIQIYEKTGTAVNSRTLAYGYNADVYYNPNQPNSYHSNPLPGAVMLETRMGNKKAFPVDSENALNASTHLKNVEEQMKLIH